MAAQFISLNYKKIKEDYYTQLTSKLRDFGENHLQYWVPEDDIISSLANLFFSLSESNYLNFEIQLKKNLINLKVENQINDNFKLFAEINFNQKDDYFILQVKDLNKDSLKLFLDNYFINFKKVETFSKIIKKSIKKNLSLKNVAEEIQREYVIEKLDNTFQVKIERFKSNLSSFNYFSEHDGYGICLSIEKKIIQKVNFYGKEDKLQNFFLDKFCNLIINKPLFEAYEHGVIRLEFELRNEKILQKIKGIITGLVLSTIFEIPKKLIKSVWTEYKNKNSVEIKNLHDYNLSESWINLSYEKKIDKIKQTIKQFKIANDLSEQFDFDNLNDDNIRITIKFYENENDLLKSKILLKFEKYIRKYLDKRLEIFYKELKDSNKLRLKNLKS